MDDIPYRAHGGEGLREKRTAPSLHHHCTSTAPSLHHHCTITAPSLHRHCTITAPCRIQRRIAWRLCSGCFRLILPRIPAISPYICPQDSCIETQCSDGSHPPERCMGATSLMLPVQVIGQGFAAWSLYHAGSTNIMTLHCSIAVPLLYHRCTIAVPSLHH